MARTRKKSANSSGSGITIESHFSDFTFYCFLIYVISYYLHITSRVSVLGAIRFDILISALVMYSIISQLDKFKERLSTPPARAIVTLLIFIIITVPLVEWPGSVLKNNLKEFLKAAVFFFFTIAAIDSIKRLKIFIWVFIACQAIRILEPLYLNITQGYWGSNTYLGVGEGFANRLSGSPYDVINPNGLGLVIATCFIFMHYMMGCSKNIKAKLIYLALLPTMAYALILSLSRSGIVAVGIATWQIFIKSRYKMAIIGVCIVGAIVACSQMTDVQKERYLSLGGASSNASANQTAQGRINHLYAQFEVGMNRPIFGHGLGTSLEANANILGKRKIAHNLFLEAFIEIGLIGLILYLVFLKRIISSLNQLAQQMRDLERTIPNASEHFDYELRLAQTLRAAFWTYIIFSISYFGVSQDWWYLMGGLAAALSTLTKQKRDQLLAESGMTEADIKNTKRVRNK